MGPEGAQALLFGMVGNTAVQTLDLRCKFKCGRREGRRQWSTKPHNEAQVGLIAVASPSLPLFHIPRFVFHCLLSTSVAQLADRGLLSIASIFDTNTSVRTLDIGRTLPSLGWVWCIIAVGCHCHSPPRLLCSVPYRQPPHSCVRSTTRPHAAQQTPTSDCQPPRQRTGG